MRQAACVALVTPNMKQIKMVTRKNSNLLGMPGGKVDPGETPLQAAIRETQEETGIVLDETMICSVPIYVAEESGFEVQTFLAIMPKNQESRQLEFRVKTVTLPISYFADAQLTAFPEYNAQVLQKLKNDTLLDILNSCDNCKEINYEHFMNVSKSVNDDSVHAVLTNSSTIETFYMVFDHFLTIENPNNYSFYIIEKNVSGIGTTQDLLVVNNLEGGITSVDVTDYNIW